MTTTKNKIYDLLKKKNLAQIEIVDELNIAPSTVNHYVQLLEAEGKIKLVKKIGKRLKIFGV